MERLKLLLLLSLGAILLTQVAAGACDQDRECYDYQVRELTPGAARQALVEMLRSKAGQALDFYDRDTVDQLAEISMVSGPDGEYRWSAACRVNRVKATYVFFVSLNDPPRLVLRSNHPKGYLIHVRVYEGSFELRDGRWVASAPRYKYALLD
jgi:hypothetical protein